ncbi:hypothetical protein K469DRAFT_218378 [Zopfia rhizophila CBS 207.26]|uniref:F-box domain-containing protein n=1 Tax=Zopfia rhizophila CBS 207.26 TaxID=1314779 RepID=A0A6A6DWT0_9PEZI|nr:hypothetical protein K469DRAFT_218378 [Zopfia rhizophila CBS 207.26]
MASTSAAGAGAPPPPPPPPRGSLDNLPAELLLDIIRYLHSEEYATFALALYPLLRRHGLVPALTKETYLRITRQRPPPSSKTGSYWRLPVEMTDEIMRYLEPADMIAFLFSNRELFLRYLPELSKDTKKGLWKSKEK